MFSGRNKVVSLDLGFRNLGVCTWDPTTGEFMFWVDSVSCEQHTGVYAMGRFARTILDSPLMDGPAVLVVEQPYLVPGNAELCAKLFSVYSCLDCCATVVPSSRRTVVSWMQKTMPGLKVNTYADRKKAAIRFVDALLEFSSQANRDAWTAAKTCPKVDDMADACVNLVHHVGLEKTLGEREAAEFVVHNRESACPASKPRGAQAAAVRRRPVRQAALRTKAQ